MGQDKRQSARFKPNGQLFTTIEYWLLMVHYMLLAGRELWHEHLDELMHDMPPPEMHFDICCSLLQHIQKRLKVGNFPTLPKEQAFFVDAKVVLARDYDFVDIPSDLKKVLIDETPHISCSMKWIQQYFSQIEPASLAPRLYIHQCRSKKEAELAVRASEREYNFRWIGKRLTFTDFKIPKGLHVFLISQIPVEPENDEGATSFFLQITPIDPPWNE